MDSNTSPLTLSIPQEAKEFATLFKLSKLTERQADRMSELLQRATLDKGLNFWIAYMTSKAGEELGLTSPDRLQDYEDQKSRLREYLSHDIDDPEKDYWSQKVKKEFDSLGIVHDCPITKDSAISDVTQAAEDLQLCLEIITQAAKRKRTKSPKSISCTQNPGSTIVRL